jgi:hypothetical protein
MAIKNRVVNTDDCWLYAGSVERNGYPQLTARVYGKEKTVMVHRLMYEALVDTLIKGMQIDHLCKVTTCINPAHLEQVTRLENLKRSECITTIHANKSTCIHGHPFEGRNLIVWVSPSGKRMRQCRECSNRSAREYSARKRSRK